VGRGQADGSSYIDNLNLGRFFSDPGALLIHLLGLDYVPNYFDILPMYMVLLAMMPVMLVAEWVHRMLPLMLMAGMLLLAQFHLLQISAEPWSDRPWFFNPFGWQLLFFSGFFIMRGTLPTPPVMRWLMWVAVVLVIATVPFAWYLVLDNFPRLRSVVTAIQPLIDKTPFGLLRYVHFLCLAYIAICLVGLGGEHLKHRLVYPVSRVLMKVGQQSLAVFITSMVLAQFIGIWLDAAG